MRPIEEVYPESADEEYFYGPSDYRPLLESIADLVVQCDADDYSGDTLALFRRGDEWGFLQFGWGSCSGCDALQACESMTEIAALRDDLSQQIAWGTQAEALAAIAAKEGEYEFHPALWADFKQKVAAIVEAPNG